MKKFKYKGVVGCIHGDFIQWNGWGFQLSAATDDLLAAIAEGLKDGS